MTVNWDARYTDLRHDLEARGVHVDGVETALKAQRIETPSWGYADGGTRFGVFRMPGAPRTVSEKLDDAAQAHKFTGIAPAVALHIPWDVPSPTLPVPAGVLGKRHDWSELSGYAASLGLTIGAINPNVFQDFDYRFGSLASERADVRSRAVDHIRECVEIMRAVKSQTLALWFADGTNFPGQGDFRKRKRRFADGLAEVYAALQDGETMLVEYKPFEPAFYHTDIADWGMAYALCTGLPSGGGTGAGGGPMAKVLVDLGHHLHGANIEHIVAFLLDEGRLGGFHFNNRKYADDDLTTGAINPYELFLIYCELVKGGREGLPGDVAYMIDESHTLKNKIVEMIQSLIAIQSAYAKALIVDWKALETAQASEDLVAAEEIVKDAFATDVRPLLWKVRSDVGLPDPVDPVRGFRQSGYADKVAADRGVGGGAGLGAG